MEFINKVSTAKEVSEIINDLTNGISGAYDLGVLFISQLPEEDINDLVNHLATKLSIKVLIGCTCAGVIGSQQEMEYQSAATLLLAKLPDVKIKPFAVTQLEVMELNSKKDWYEYFQIFPNENPIFIALPDPFSVNLNKFIFDLNQAYPMCPIVGGLASEATQPHSNTLIVNQDQYKEGIVGVALTGNIALQTIVSQGCRPIGKNFIITKSEKNIIYQLAGRPFIQVLQEVLQEASLEDQNLAKEAIFVGLAMDEYKHKLKSGDFLIRGVMGVDQTSGAGAVGDYVQQGQTVQFHVRDAQTATEELNEMLNQQQSHNNYLKPKGALLFSCNGRGQNLFNEANHDINIVQKKIGPVALAGFFCAGEIGPVGKANFLHGFTDSIALFYPKN